MASISQIRTGLATRLGTISGLRTSAFMPDNPNPPVAIVNVLVIVGRVDERTAQSNLDAYVSSTGSSSIKLAIEGDKTLGGVVFDTRVSEMRNYGQLPVSEIVYLTAEFTVLCYAD